MMTRRLLSPLKWLHPSQLIRLLADYRLGGFMMLCLALGSTTREISIYKPFLFILSTLYIGWCVCRVNRDSLIWRLKTPLIFLLFFFGLSLLYLVPLPPALWSALPGRDLSAQGFEVLGLVKPWMPLSLSPEKSMFSLLGFLPPLAVILGVGTATTIELKRAFWAIIIWAIITIVFCLIQAMTLNVNLTLYGGAPLGRPSGFFSNINHNASFLLMILPLSIGLLFTSIARQKRGRVGKASICLSTLAAFGAVIGILMSFSVAGYLILPCLLLASLLVCSPSTGLAKTLLFGLGLTIILGVFIDFFMGGFFLDLLAELQGDTIGKRKSIYLHTLHSVGVYFPFGSGLGSFYEASRPFMPISTTIIKHAHNEVLETVHSFGLAGFGLLLAFVVWWAKMIVQNFKRTRRAQQQSRSTIILSRCACLSTLSVMVHSMVSFPLHTNSLSSLFVFLVCYIVLLWDV